MPDGREFKLDRKNIVDLYALSPMQEGMLYHYLTNPDSMEYREQIAFNLTGRLNRDVFTQAWNLVVSANEMLRTVIAWEGLDKPVQIVLKSPKEMVEFHDFTGLEDESLRQRELAGLKEQELQKGFDLRQGALFRVVLCKLGEEEYELILSNHHIIFDGWSTGIILREFLQTYTELLGGNRPSVRSKTRFKEYVKYLQAMERVPQESFWRSYLEDFTLRTPLPGALDFRVAEDQSQDCPHTYKAVKLVQPISPEVTALLQGLAQDQKVTTGALFYTAWGILLQCYGWVEDVMFGVTVAGRSLPLSGIEEMVGLFINTVPLRVTPTPRQTVQELLQTVNQRVQKVQEFAYYPLAEIQALSAVDAREGLFDSIVVIDNYPLDRELATLNRRQVSSGLKLNSQEMVELTNYDLVLGITVGETCEVHLGYNPERYNEKCVEHLMESYLYLLVQMTKHPNEEVQQIQLVPTALREYLLKTFCQSSLKPESPDGEMTIQACFAAQVQKTPDAIAVVYRDSSLTYGQLDMAANQVAQYLRSKGVGPESLVGLLAGRSLEMVTGMLGILQTGAAYVPLDPDLPGERLRYMVSDSGLSLILTAHAPVERRAELSVEFQDVELIALEQLLPTPQILPEDKEQHQVTAANLAYIIYTSGSTGTPKGVMVEGRSVVNLARWFGRRYNLAKNQRVIQMANFSFDVSVEEILGSLLNGATIYMPDQEVILHPERFCAYVREHAIQVAQFVPLILQELLAGAAKLPSLEVIICGGERLPEGLKDEILQLGYTLYNHYGPTEVTVDALTARCSAERVSLGRPVDNIRAYILSPTGMLQPPGAVGELCLAGRGLARGYLNNPELTAGRFVPDPFHAGERMYRTGDLARWSMEGEVEFLGRLDEQIKIRGHRIEPGEIENCLQNHPLIAEAAVVALPGPLASSHLAAFVVPRKGNLTVQADSRVYQVFTAEQKADFQGKMEGLHVDSWPAFFVGDQVVQMYWPQLYEVFPDWQIGLTVDGVNVLAVGNTIPIEWDGTPDGLPKGWDDAVLRGFALKETPGRKPNTLCVLAGAVDPESQGHGLSYHLLKAMNLLALSHNVEFVLIPVRPTRKEEFPALSLEEYASMRREDGFAYDHWLRVHERLGGKVVGYSPQSQEITGTVEEWEAWTGEHFKSSGKYLICGAMQPVEINCAENRGVYYDQAVWIQHDPKKYRSELQATLHLDELRQYLEQKLPRYMVPTSYTILEKLPLTPSGKVNRKALQFAERQSVEEGNTYSPPRNALEISLANIWASLLHVERVGIRDHFFELGGHSLLATRLVTRIQKEWKIALPLRQIFKTPVLEELAGYLSRALQTEDRPIQPAAYQECYPLSSAQKRMYILHQLAGVKTSYNLPGGVWLRGRLDIERLRGAFRALIARHESLRTSFEQQNGEPVQRIHPTVEFELAVTAIDDAELEQVFAEFVRPFDLATAPLFRAELFQLTAERYLLLFDMDHIISDGVSLDLFVEELAQLYADQPLPPLAIQYKDFAVWQEEQLQAEAYKQDEAFWLETFRGEIPVLDLPVDKTRSGVQDFSGETYRFSLPAEATKSINEAVAQHEVTLFMYLYACYHLLLARYTGQDEIVVGTPVAGRLHSDLERVIGVFVNTLALRSTLTDTWQFTELLAEIKERTVRAFEHQNYPFEMLVERLQITRHPGRNPLFDTMLVLQTDGSKGISLRDVQIRAFELPNAIARFDLTLHAMENDGQLEFGLQYRTDLFAAETIERMAGHYLNLLLDSVASPEKQLYSLNLMTPEERVLLLQQWNGITADYPHEKTVSQLFGEQVAKWPERIAVNLGTEQLTYRQLNEYANRLARRLRELGVGPDQIVGLLAERSVEMIIGILGIIKAGGAYLPVEPDYPAERIEFMLTDSATNVLVVQKALYAEKQGLNFVGTVLDLAEIYAGEVLSMEEENEEALSMEEGVLESGEDHWQAANPANLCYIIYTSGSTGRPKGVMVENRNVVRLMVHNRFQFDFSERDVWTMFHSYCFDFSVWEMYGALLYGGRLVIVPKRVAQETKKFLELIYHERVTVLNQTPTVFYNLSNAEMKRAKGGLAIRYIIFGGEALQPALLKDWKTRYPETRLINMYGITETTVHVTFKEITEKEIAAGISNIGRAIPTLTTYVLDRHSNLAPLGVPGELYVGGDGVARGYLNRPELTAERFCENPLKAGERVYRSGDLVRMRSNGELEYLGRIDRQVKIRGFRIELGEIEKELTCHLGIESAVVLDKNDAEGDKYLAAYLVFRSAVSVADLREYLQRRVPHYMVPAQFVAVEQIPLTGNGKVDRQALLAIAEVLDAGSGDLALETEHELQLARIWSELLQVETVGRNDDFFALGGHSLKATILLTRLEKQFGPVIQLEDIFKHPILRELAHVIALRTGSCEQTASIPVHPGRESYPLSPAQKRLYVLSQLDKEGLHYNLPLVYALDGTLDFERLTHALQQLVDRHAAFRTFFTVDTEPVQRILPHLTFRPEYIRAAEGEWPRLIQEFIRPFNLEQAPLFRFALIEDCQRSLLLLDMHHSIADGISFKIFLQELLELYAGRMLMAEPVVQYTDYVLWFLDWLGSDQCRQARDYWLGEYAGEIPVLNLPTDHPRPAQYSFVGDAISLVIPADLTEAVKSEASRQGVTFYTLLFAAYNLLLARLAGQEEVVVGTPVAGRPHADVEQVIGMFVNTLAIRSRVPGTRCFEEFSGETQEHLLQVFAHGLYPFEELVDELHLVRDLSRNPLFDTMFVLQNTGVEELRIAEFAIEPYEYTLQVAKFDLVFNAMERNGQIEFTVEYSQRLFERPTVERLVQRYADVLAQVVSEPTIRLKDVEILLPKEKSLLLEVFCTTGNREFAPKSIPQLFLEQAAQCPHFPAVYDHDTTLTYAELDAEAERLAGILQSYGVLPGQIVGILMERSLSAVIAMLAVLKTGGVYLPVDPDYPLERIGFMLADSGCVLLLTAAGQRVNERFSGTVIEYTWGVTELPSVNQSERQAVSTQTTDLAYVIYTSGSTGVPKGVMIAHQGIANLQSFFKNEWKIGAADRILQFASLAFDASVWEIWMALLTGGTLYIPDQATIYDPVKFTAYLQTQQITVVTLPPAYLNNLNPEALPGLRLVITAGSATSSELVHRWQARTRYINAYGPTEVTICASVWEALATFAGQVVPIGRALDHTEIYILDEGGRLQPIGVYGEICVAGVGLARGYLNRPELTAEKFVSHPMQPGKRLYRTGDLGRWRHDGQLEFAGRLDQQVKIRGYRIEPGEIEQRVLAFAGIEAAAVVEHTELDGSALALYYVADRAIVEENLRSYLREMLPNYMIPAYFISLPELPLTVNGKLDRKALPSPEQVERVSEYLQPVTEMEERLQRIWQEVLGLELISTQESFFDLGGHSLKAMRLSSIARKELGRELPLSLIFAQPTIREQASYLSQRIQQLAHSLRAADKRDFYPLSSAQRRLLVLNRLNPGDIRYNMPGVLAIEGTLDEQRLESALQALVARHEPLRTVFLFRDGEPVQQIQEQVELAIIQVNEAADLESASMLELDRALEWFLQAFDLSVAPLVRVGIVTCGDSQQYLLFDLHHIIADGVSMEIIMRDLAQLYGGAHLPALTLQYKDYAVWQEEFLRSAALAEQERYWLEVYTDELPVLDLRTDYQRPPTMDFAAETVSTIVSETLTARLAEYAAGQGVTLFMLLFAGYTALLHRYSGSDDLVTGIPVAGRTHADLENIVGMFVNTLALRTAPRGELKFSEYLQEVRDLTVQAYQYQDYPFELLVDRLALPVDLSRNPIYDQMFHVQNAVSASLKIEGTQLRPVPFDPPVTKCDLTVTIHENGNQLQVSWKYRTSLFCSGTIERYARHYMQLLTEILDAPELYLQAIPLCSSEERHHLLYGFNETAKEFPEVATLQRIFEEQVAKHPERTAVVTGESELSYAALNRRANQLARVLRQMGVQPDEPVGLRLERSPEMLIAILGVLKAGGAYLPISPYDPAARVEEILQDSGARILLTRPELARGLAFAGEILDLTNCILQQSDSTDLSAIHTSENLAYILYTSGSTGKPKGVMIEHGSVVNTIRHLQSRYPLTQDDVILQSTVYTFDASVRELFWWYFNGSRCCLLAQDAEKDPLAMLETISRHQVTLIKFVPVMLKEILTAASGARRKQVSTVKYVFVGGEALPREVVKIFYQVFPKTTVFCNVYGPTEASIHATEYFLQPQDTLGTGAYLSIGKPISNDRVYILDAQQEPVPVGVIGEIYLAGSGVGRGYCNRPELTAERFLLDPFVPGQRMYRTGDLAYWQPDGNVSYTGRMDQQVKIRGFRIETGEIERALLNEAGVQAAVVVDRVDGNGDRTLCAYLVTADGVDFVDVRKRLAQILPGYMIPSAFVRLPGLPLTASGKVDRKALPAPEEEAFSPRAYVAPETELEKTLARIWSQILGVAAVGLEDSFFELGGHSIKATQLVTRVLQECRLELPLRQIFSVPTLREQANYLAQIEEQQYLAITPAPEAPYYPLSSAQKRIFFLQQRHPESTSYNMPLALRLEGQLVEERLQQALHALSARHESLRSSFAFVGGEPVQFVQPAARVTFTVIVEDNLPPEEWVRQFIRPFDLTTDPLLRVQLVHYRDWYLLLLDLHHIVSDGLSMKILVRELTELYQGRELAALPVQYKDFAVWQHRFRDSDLYRKEAAYWLQELQGLVYTQFPPSPLAGDENPYHPVEATWDRALVTQIEAFCQQHRITRFVLILALFKIVLYKELKQEDLAVGIPVAGRNTPGLEDVIGVFLNVLILRSRLTEQSQFVEYIQQLQETVITAQENQDYPYEELYAALLESSGGGPEHLFSILFNYMPLMAEGEIDFGELQMRPLGAVEIDNKYDLTLYVKEGDAKFEFNLVYNPRLYTEHVMRRVLNDLQQIVETILSTQELTIGELELTETTATEDLLDFDADFDNEDFFAGEEGLL